MATLTFESAEAMRDWGKRLALPLKRGDVIALIGDLGAGKTTLVQGIAEGWGYKRRANSPTFALVNEYRSPRGTLLHMDMYRLTPAELAAFPLEDYLSDDAVTLIEWADRVSDRLPPQALVLKFNMISARIRRVGLKAPPSWQKRLRPLLA